MAQLSYLEFILETTHDEGYLQKSIHIRTAKVIRITETNSKSVLEMSEGVDKSLK
jgi:hypothetical protein